ncbi:MAG: single-stranded DNA-binding protein [Clostridiales bacterium]|nr:single-stranded DNA-binding protein [Clostridiales bacterium]
MVQPTNNRIILCGTATENPIFSHEVFGESFYIFKLEVKRLSGQSDILPIMISERLVLNEDIIMGKRYLIEGQLRSYNIITDNKSKLQLQTFAREISIDETGDDINQIEFNGFICKTPVYRVTPFAREIADVLIAVNRAYGKSDYIPSICWGRNARYCQQLNVGDSIHIEGRLQSREYQKKLDDNSIINKIAYEVSVSKLSVDKDENKELCEE